MRVGFDGPSVEMLLYIPTTRKDQDTHLVFSRCISGVRPIAASLALRLLGALLAPTTQPACRLVTDTQAMFDEQPASSTHTRSSGG